MKNARQSGFTMVEVAIALVIMGLLIGALLKGQQMIVNSKLKRLEKENSGLVAAIASYQDRYRQLPGDDFRADQRFVLYTDGSNDPDPADINGDGNGIIDGDWIAATNTETSNFWKHLRAAGMIPGGGDDATQPSNPYGGLIGVRDGALLIPGHVIVFGSIEGQIAKLLESRLDDGSPASGNIQSDFTAADMNTFLVSSAGSSYSDASRYFMALGI